LNFRKAGATNRPMGGFGGNKYCPKKPKKETKKPLTLDPKTSGLKAAKNPAEAHGGNVKGGTNEKEKGSK